MGNHNCQILLNDGSGRFMDTGKKLTLQGHGVALGDVDADGDKDVFFANFRNGPNELWFNGLKN
jgi:hypothetical protein